jgi:multidrug transporter EmrE-like cation transporter
MSWVYLFIAGVFEVGFTTFLKLSDNFSKLWPTIGFFVFSIGSFFFSPKPCIRFLWELPMLYGRELEYLEL